MAYVWSTIWRKASSRAHGSPVWTAYCAKTDPTISGAYQSDRPQQQLDSGKAHAPLYTSPPDTASALLWLRNSPRTLRASLRQFGKSSGWPAMHGAASAVIEQVWVGLSQSQK